MLLIEHLQEFDTEAFRNEWINNIDYITDEKISELQYKAEQLKGMCKARSSLIESNIYRPSSVNLTLLFKKL
jgi:hypothetical protein